MKSLFLLVALLFAPVLSAQQDRLQIEADASVFRYDNERQLWEWCYSFPDTALVYSMRNGQNVGEMYFRITILDTADALVKNEEWRVANTYDNSNSVRNLIGVKSFVLNPGRYKVYCIIADMARRQDSIGRSFEIVMPDVITNRIAMSDVQLATSIEMAHAQSHPAYVKGALSVLPNPSVQYIFPAVSEDSISDGILLPYYAEVYNVDTYAPGGIEARFTILDVGRRPVLEFNRSYPGDRNTVQIFGNLPLDTLSSGLYYFQLNIADREGKVVATSQRRFYVLNAGKAPELKLFAETQDYERSEFALMGDERVQEEFDQLKPLLPYHEQDKFGLLTDIVAKRKFLYVYWKQQDPDPETPENKARADFKALIDYANKFYSTLQTPGWKTDRGRVLRQYGKPDRVDVAPYTPEAKPYATWYYYAIQGGVQFSFVELNNIDYTLVHSTAKSEVSEPQWYKRFAEVLGSTQFSR